MGTVAMHFEAPMPEPTGSIETAQADLERAGYAIVSDVLPRAVLREARQALADEIRREEAIDVQRVRRAEAVYLDPDDTNRRLNRLPDRHPIFRHLVALPVALHMTRHILGPTVLNESYLVHSYDANVTRPGGAAQGLHLDRTGPNDGYTKPLQSRFILCLDPFDEENGATRVVPGSHRWSIVDTTGATDYETVPALAPAGSLIIYTDLLLHGTGANVSADRERASLNFGYCPPWCRPMVNYPLALDPKAMEGSSPLLRQLLGFSDTMVGFVEQWNSANDELRALCVPATMDW